MAGEKISPYKEAIVMMKAKDEAERKQVLELRTKIRNRKIFNPVTETDKREVNSRAADVVRELSGRDSVEELYNVIKDRSKTPAQKELAEKNIDKLGKAVFLVMNYEGNEDLATRIIAGSKSVEEVLPRPFKGLGDAVVNQLIKSIEVRGALEEVDLVRSRIDFSDPRDVKDFIEEVDEVRSRLNKIKVESKYNSEVITAKAYLKHLKDKYGSRTATPAGGEGEVVKAINKMADKLPDRDTPEEKERNMYREMYDYYYSGLLHESTQDDNPFSNLAPEWMQRNPDKTLLQKQFQLANAAYHKKRMGGFSADALFDSKGEATYGATNEIMQRLYENVPGVKESLESFAQDFFVGSRENGEYILKLKDTDEVAQKKFSDLRKLQLSMIDKLVGPGKKFNSGKIEKDRAEAVRAVSIAWNLLYVGHVFEDADTTKCLKGEISAPQAWNIMHPARKAWDKLIKTGAKDAGTEETFGGQKGQFLLRQIERSSFDPESREFVDSYKSGKFHPFPERLLTSYFIFNKVKVEGSDDKMPMAQALMEGKTIDFVGDGASNDSWGGYYDFASTARGLYDLTTGKTSLVLEVNDGKASKEMVDWANTLADARNKLRGNKLIFPYINNPEFLLWSIVASVKGGVYMENPNLVMMTPTVFTVSQYFELRSLFEQRQLVANKDEQQWVMKALNCDGPNSDGKRKRIAGRGGLLSYFGF